MNFFTPTALVAFVCLFFSLSTPDLLGQTEKVRGIPFHGKISAVDTTAQTVTLVGKKSTRVFHLTATTRITDGEGNASTLAAATVGEPVGGSYIKGADGTLTLHSLRLGAKGGATKMESEPMATTAKPIAATAPAPPPGAGAPPPSTPVAPAVATSTAPEMAAPATAKKKRFSGKIVSVDATAHTLVVHGLTLTVTDPALMSGLVAGDKVSGSYVLGDGGTMTVVTLKKGK